MRRVRGVCRRLCCCSHSSSACDHLGERQPLNTAEEDGLKPPPLKRKRSVWERAAARLGLLLRFERTAGWNEDSSDSLPDCLLRYEQRIELLPLLPATMRQRTWSCLFDTAEHGCSIKSLLQRCSGRGPTLFLIRDRQKHVFGAFAAEAWRPEPEPHFYGNGDSFLFSTWPESEGFRAWKWSGGNRMFQCISIDFVAFGGGGHFGIWLGRSLSSGSTGPCATYANTALTEHAAAGGLKEPHRGDSAFDVLDVQVWAFV